MPRYPQLPQLDSSYSASDRALIEAARKLDPDVLTSPVPDHILESRRKCEASFHEFVRQAWSVAEPHFPFVDGWMVGCLAEHLQACYERELLKLIISMPPRHGKSLFAAVLWFAWCWAKSPWERFIYSSYSEQFCYRDSDKSERLISSKWYQDRWGGAYTLMGQAKSRLTNDKGGHRIAGSPMGRGVGEGGSIIVGDDMNKPQSIYSKAGRELPQTYWSETMAGRADDPLTTVRLQIQHRLHHDDMSGWLRGRDIGYECLVLPVHYNPKRYFGNALEAKAAGCRNPIIPTSFQLSHPQWQDPRTEAGQLLFPERFTEEAVKLVTGEFSLAAAPAQNEQDPGTASGKMVKSEWFRTFTTETRYLRRPAGVQEEVVVVLGEDEATVKAPRVPVKDLVFFQIIDTAETVKKTSAYTVIGTMAVAAIPGVGRWLLLWHFARERWFVTEQWTAIKEYKEGRAVWDPELRKFVKKGASAPWPGKIRFQAIEPKSSGTGLLQAARAEGTPLRALEGPDYQGNKTQRAYPLLELYISGLIFHPAGERWVENLETELTEFEPGGGGDATKDMFDVAAYGAISFNKDRTLAHTAASTSSLIEEGQAARRREEAGGIDSTYLQIGGHRIPNPFDD